MPSNVLQVIPQYPHCDSRVLHGPSEGCIYCNAHPDWQELRDMWGINFTGENDPNKIPCPSTHRRPLNMVHAWGGNRPRHETESSEPTAPQQPEEAAPKSAYDLLREDHFK